MLTMLTLAATLFATGPQANASHHDFRLPGEAIVRGEGRCPVSQGVTVCASRAEANRRWRVLSADAPTGPADRAAGAHVAALRVQPARCATPVETGLRCVLPTQVARITLGE